MSLSTSSRLVTAMSTASHTGTVVPQRLNAPARPGPRMKPSPKATPISPKARARFSGLLMSANTAPAVAAVPPLNPSIILPVNSNSSGQGLAAGQGSSRVSANRPRPTTVPATQVAITGRRP